MPIRTVVIKSLNWGGTSTCRVTHGLHVISDVGYFIAIGTWSEGYLNVLTTWQLGSFTVSDPRESKGKLQCLLWSSLRIHMPSFLKCLTGFTVQHIQYGSEIPRHKIPGRKKCWVPSWMGMMSQAHGSLRHGTDIPYCYLSHLTTISTLNLSGLLRKDFQHHYFWLRLTSAGVYTSRSVLSGLWIVFSFSRWVSS
jgi:hypothetical protein